MTVLEFLIQTAKMRDKYKIPFYPYMSQIPNNVLNKPDIYSDLIRRCRFNVSVDPVDCEK